MRDFISIECNIGFGYTDITDIDKALSIRLPYASECFDRTREAIFGVTGSYFGDLSKLVEYQVNMGIYSQLGNDDVNSCFLAKLINLGSYEYNTFRTPDGHLVDGCLLRFPNRYFVLTKDYRLFVSAGGCKSIKRGKLPLESPIYLDLSNYSESRITFNIAYYSKHYIQFDVMKSSCWIRHIHLVGFVFLGFQLIDVLNNPNTRNISFKDLELNHLNKDQYKNTLDNLEWCTSSQNKLHRDVYNTIIQYVSTKRSTLKDTRYDSIYSKLIFDGLSVYEIEESIKVKDKLHLSNILDAYLIMNGILVGGVTL